MQGQPKRKFAAEFKSRVVLEVLSGRSSVAALARKHRLKDKLIYEWREQALARLPQVFSRSNDGVAQEHRVAELERLIGQLTIENEALKKASLWLSRLSRSNDNS
ncbi:MAG: transposase [Chloroflexi bacterium]|nr:transposase [Chloroflexota bacterium]